MKHLSITLLMAFSICGFCNGQANTKLITNRQADSIDKANAKTISLDGRAIQKATVDKTDSSIWITGNMRRDHRIFGYEKPAINSRKMILLSIFTTDVEGNPFRCPYGAWYQTSDMNDMQVKFVSRNGAFIKANIIKAGTVKGTVYFLSKWIVFEK